MVKLFVSGTGGSDRNEARTMVRRMLPDADQTAGNAYGVRRP